MVEIGLIVLKAFAHNQQLSKEINEKITIEWVWLMFSNFIDKIFGETGEYKREKEKWIKDVARVVPWILKPENMRLYAYELII